MSVHVGNRIKYLVEKNYKGTKKEFSEAIGLKQYPNLFRIFDKENVSSKVLNKIAEVLNIPVTEFLKEDLSIVNEPTSLYGSELKELEILRKRVLDLERIIKMQDKELADCNNKYHEVLKKADKKSH